MGDLATGPCPSQLVIQTDWWPQAEHGGLYELIEPGSLADADAFAYRGALRDDYADDDTVDAADRHGIRTLELRAGGPAVGGQDPVGIAATDPDIYLTLVDTDQAIGLAVDSEPMVGVVATLDRHPQALLWDSMALPRVRTRNLAELDVEFVLDIPDTAIDVLVDNGVLNPDRVTRTEGRIGRWVAGAGTRVQSGTLTSDAFRYAEGSGTPLAEIGSRLLDDLGYRPYPAMVAISADRLDDERECLTRLVPLIQRAWVAYLTDPVATNDELVLINEAYGPWWEDDSVLNGWALDRFADNRIADNGPDTTYGNFDLPRVRMLIDQLTPEPDPEEGEGAARELLPVESVVTNEFIDPSIGLPPPEIKGTG